MSRPAGLSVSIAVIVLTAAVWPSAAGAFWERSHWAACSEAPTQAERLRLNCHIFVPVDHWPVSLYRWPADQHRFWREERRRGSPLVQK
jgi:hypothetical protein